ncbi:MAG: hypothetical protein GY832_06175 [Chloroflexi bacterium]|nr:hypothetical protein [Chloroflexota bacterium]
MTNSEIAYSANAGVLVESADHLIRHNTIHDCDSYGVYNGNTSNITVKAEYNWWGDISGPAPFGSGDGINYSTYSCGTDCTYDVYHVDADPWIGKQAQESENLIDDALPDDAIRNTAEMEAGVPHIASAQSQYDFFLFGVGAEQSTDRITVKVDWNGSDAGDGSPGDVQFRLKTNTYTGAGDTSGIVYDMPTERLKAGFNDLEIVAINAEGIESKPFSVQVARFLAPKWLIKLNVNGGDLVVKVTRKPNYTEGKITVMFPFKPWGAEFDLPEYIPFIGGKNGVPPQRAGFSLSMRSDGKGKVQVIGETEFKLKGNKIKGQLVGEGNLQFSSYDLVLTGGSLNSDMEGTIKLKESVLVALPPIAAAAHTPIIGGILKTVYVEGKVQIGINAGFGFESSSDGSDLEWVGVEGGGDLKVTIVLGIDPGDLGIVDASIYGGGQGGMQFQAPPNPSYLKEISGGFFVGAKLEALGFEIGTEKTWEYSYEPQATRMAGSNTLTIATPMLIARPIIVSETEWRIEQPDYGDIPYAQFVGNRSVRAPHAPLEILSLTETPLITNLYPQANPALVLHGSDAVLVWAHDDTTLPDSQSKEILSTWWNGISWATPISITDNTMSEFNPQIALAGSDQALAVWERINDPALPMTATFDLTITRKVELAYAAFDLNTHTWTLPNLLTSNSGLDHRPHLSAGQDDTSMVTWVNNSAGELIGTSDAPDVLQYAIWDGAIWNFGTIASNITGTLGMGLAYRDVNSATLVLSLDTDGYLTTTSDIELFYTEWNGSSWNSLTQVTTNTVPDESPTILYTSTGERQLVWLQDGQIVLLGDDWSATPTDTQIESDSAALRNFRVSLNDEDNLMLIWQGMSEAGADLYYALYDADTAIWSLESQLTDSNAMEKQISPAFDPNGQLMVAYALDHLTETVRIISPTLTITGVTEYNRTDLYILHYTPDTDLTITDLSLPEYFDNPWPGDSVDVNITVQNAGDWAVVSPTIAFYDGDPGAGGIFITSTHVISGPLAGGASEQVSIRWTVPVTPVQPHTLYAVLDPSGAITETDETNNVITLTTTTPDVAVSSVRTYYYDQHDAVPLAVVANNGPVTATNILVEFREGTVTGTVAYSQTVLELEPYGLVAITDTWDVTGWTEGAYTYYTVVDSGDTIFEVNEADNWDYFPVKVLPDLVIYSGDVQADLNPATGGPVTVTVRNWGTADASGVKVTLYEGPVITTNGLGQSAATALYTWTVPSLAVDSDGDTTLNTTIDHRPNRLFAIADPGRIITEVEEYNNVALVVQPISITFRYHDMESIIPSTATITISGDWTTNTITMTGAVDVYSVTVNTAETPLIYRYVVEGDVYLLNTYTRTVTPTVATIYDDYRLVTADDTQLIGPATLSTTIGTPTTPITAQVTLANVTSLTGTTFAAEIGHGAGITLTDWTWTTIGYVGDVGNADQFVGIITPTVSGVYSYTVRFDGNWGVGNPNTAWLYADLDGTANGFDLGNVGVLSVP